MKVLVLGICVIQKLKGLWVWGTPVELVIDGVKVSVLLDTEGFESVGKSNVYDDR
ncbi:P-loop containing nucleoside triphosphate hydrolase protein [Dioscorea alata]|uniref:P-loop containing nucleoside triphosphate hydrolase protein n=1 Tax=Dioscorea alata TaxID=55571 RepID=A0ACB7V5P7_DIOAL|nr:P-loop containing nucleoside triphosphate hydrolase protein [Dioscorea alata]